MRDGIKRSQSIFDLTRGEIYQISWFLVSPDPSESINKLWHQPFFPLINSPQHLEDNDDDDDDDDDDNDNDDDSNKV